MKTLLTLALVVLSQGEQTTLSTVAMKHIPLKKLKQTPGLLNFLSSTQNSQKFLETKNQIKLKNYSNTQFVGQVGVGDPPQYLDVIFDTGSANFWVNSKLCHDFACESHKAYDHALSSAYSPLHKAIQVEFGTGKIKGEINSDTVTLAGIQIPNQKFGEITDEVGEVFVEGKFSGILGLGFPSMAAFGFLPVFDSIIKQSLLSSNIISFYYSFKNSEDSFVTLGATDPSKYDPPIYWQEVIKGHEYYWLIEVEDILVGEKSLGLCPEGCKAAVDTGTSLLTAPSEQLRRTMQALSLNCKEMDSMPSLAFLIGGVKFELEAKDYLMTEEAPGVHKSNTECALAVMPLDVPGPQ